MKAWERPETIIVNEPYWTPTAKLADIVLPVTTPLERNDIGASGGEDFIVAMKKVAEPFAEARDDFAIFCALGERMQIDFADGLDEDGWLRRLYGITQSSAADKGVDMPDFERFWEEGLFDLQPMAKPMIMLEQFRYDPAAFPLPTPSGKIEIFSETLARFELQDCPAHPTWLQPPEWLGSNIHPTDSLHLISDQPTRRLHSQLDASPHSKAGKITGREPVDLHPLDAEARGIVQGDLVEIYNERGRCLSAARVTDAVMRGVVRLSTGAWFDPDFATGLEKHGNPNAVTLDQGASSLSQGCSAQTCLVEIRRVTYHAPVITAFRIPVERQ